MAYIINKTNGVPATLTNSVDGVLEDGETDSSMSVSLIGKNTANYGEAFNENFIKLLESNANVTEPANPLTGQLWFDTTKKQLNVYDELNGFVPVRPLDLATGVLDETILDTISAEHEIVKIIAGGKIVAIISPDPEFTPAVSIAGFPTISPGIQLVANNSLALGITPTLTGTADSAYSLIDPVNGAIFETDRIVRADVTTGIINLQNISGTNAGELTGLNTPASNTDAANKLYVDTEIVSAIAASQLSGVLFANGSVAMAADFNLGNNQIINVGNPLNVGDAANKSYVDTEIATVVAADGTIPVTGNLSFNNNRLINLGNPVNSADAANKSYVDSATQTAAQILTAIKTVDGSGSGLDADTLDGLDSTAFALQTDLSLKANKANPQLTGVVNVAGSIVSTGDITAFSDRSLKDNIETIPDALAKLGKINGVTFTRNDINDNKRYAGVIAQEIEAVLPEVVTTSESGLKSVAYGNLVGLLIEAIKELQADVAALKK